MRIRVQTVHQLALSAIIIAVLFTVGGLHPHVGHAEVKAFPTAEGFGAKSVGGRGGRVIKVTNLNDSGTGSLRACMTATGARTCVFTTGGTINLNSDIAVNESSMSYLTVAGQTAPGGGIQLRNFGIKLLYDVHDIIIRHIRIRTSHGGTPELYQTGFSLLIYGSGASKPNNIIIDHVSMQWAPYVSHEYAGTLDATTQWSLIGVGETEQDYTDPQGNPALSMGMALNGWGSEESRLSFHHNLLTTSQVRQPVSGQGLTDFVNNIMFNWMGCEYGAQFGTAGNNDSNGGWLSRNNLVNNIWLAGPATCEPNLIATLGRNPNAQVYLSGIRAPNCGGASCGNPTLSQAGFRGDYNDGAPTFSGDGPYRVSTPFTAPPITTTPLASLESTLVANVGATKPSRDSLDTFYLNKFGNRQGTGAYGQCGRCNQAYPTLAAGTAPTDSDGDGIPDTWETGHGLNPNSSADGARTSGNGYTNLENYLNELAGDSGTNSPLAAPANLIRVQVVTP